MLTLSAAHILMETVDTSYARFGLLLSPVAWEGVILWLFGVDPGPGTRSPTRISVAGSTSLAVLVTIAVSFARRCGASCGCRHDGSEHGVGDATAETATIVFTDVSRWYGNVVAVNGMSFSVSPGITGLLGPNGAGKSTVLHMLSGFLQPSAGEVTVLGEPAWRNPELYRRLGLVPERESVYGSLTGYEFVRLNARLQGLASRRRRREAAIREVDLEEAAARATGGYSKGMKQRIKIAAALVHDPEVLLLDEPFNGADPRQRLHMIELLPQLAAEGRTLIFSSHILEEVERLAERVLVVVGGRLAASGDFREIRRLMTDRPHTFTLRTSGDRPLAAALVADASVARRGARRGPAHRAHVAARRLRPGRTDDRALLRGFAPRAPSHRRVARGRLRLPGEPMIGIIAALTLRQLIGRGRTLLMGLLALLPVLLAIAYRLGSRTPTSRGGSRRCCSRGSS